MKRWTFLFILPIWAAFYVGCGTSETVLGKPDYLGTDFPIFQRGDSLVYTFKTYTSVSNATRSLVNDHFVKLKYVGDSSVSGESYMMVELTGTLAESNAVEVQETVLVRLEPQGIPNIQESSGALSTPQFLMGKVVFTEHSISALAHTLLDRSSIGYDVDLFHFDRSISGTGKIKYAGNSEETWNVAETVNYENQVLMEGLYSYGQSGLLRGELNWSGVDFRGWAGEPLGQAAVTQIFELL